MAERQIAKLEQRRLGGDERRRWKMVVHLISQAKSLSYAGEFTAAREMLERALRLLPTQQRSRWQRNRVSPSSNYPQTLNKFGPLIAALHAAVSSENWTEVLTKADALLELAPEFPPALEARRRAWQAVGMKSPAKPLPQYAKFAALGKRL